MPESVSFEDPWDNTEYYGPYGMTKDYWKDAWYKEETKHDFLSCMTDWTCANQTLDNYIKRSVDMKNVNVLIWLLSCETVPMVFSGCWSQSKLNGIHDNELPIS